MKATVKLRNDVLDLTAKTGNTQLEKMREIHKTLVPITEKELGAFADDMTPNKVQNIISLVGKVRQLKDSIVSTAHSWQVQPGSIFADVSELEKYGDTLYCASVAAFAARCAVSKSAEKLLKSASDQATKALDFAEAKSVVLPEFLAVRLRRIRDANKPAAKDD